MILLTHIFIALLSIIVATAALVAPSKNIITGAYALVAGTLISGTYLVASTSGHLLQACVSGLLYITVVSVLIIAAQKKLSAIKIKS